VITSLQIIKWFAFLLRTQCWDIDNGFSSYYTDTVQTPNAVGLYPKPPTSKLPHPFSNLPSRLGTMKNFQTVENFCWPHLTRYGLVGLGIESRLVLDFPHPSRPALGSTRPPVQYEDRGIDHPPHLAQRSKKEYSYISNFHWAFMGCCRVNMSLYLKRLCLLLSLPLPVLLLKTVTITCLKNVNEEHGVYVFRGQMTQDKCHYSEYHLSGQFSPIINNVNTG